MMRKSDSPIRIGIGGARIVRVTQKRIEYIDGAGQEQFVDLEECSKNWVGWHDDHSKEFLPLPNATEQNIVSWNARCVGKRGAMDHPPWAEFMDERTTCFEFETYDALYRELLGPLKQVGWQTFDAN